MTSLASAPRLLLVEDDTELLCIVQEALEEDGYRVTPTTTLPDSLAALGERLFHLVLTDLFLQPAQPHPLQSIQPLIEPGRAHPGGGDDRLARA